MAEIAVQLAMVNGVPAALVAGLGLAISLLLYGEKAKGTTRRTRP